MRWSACTRGASCRHGPGSAHCALPVPPPDQRRPVRQDAPDHVPHLWPDLSVESTLGGPARFAPDHLFGLDAPKCRLVRL
jgi:hypothetical protein